MTIDCIKSHLVPRVSDLNVTLLAALAMAQMSNQPTLVPTHHSVFLCRLFDSFVYARVPPSFSSAPWASLTEAPADGLAASS